MTRVHPSVVIAWIEKAREKFGPTTPENKAEITRWVMAQCEAEPEPRDYAKAAAGDES